MTKSYKNIAITAMFAVNLTALIFITTLVRHATSIVVNRYAALSFFDALNKLPLPSDTVQAAALCVFSLLVLLTYAQTLKKDNMTLAVLNCSAQVLLCIAVMYLLDFHYNGILFIPLVNIIIRLNKNSVRFSLMLVVIAAYLFLDYDIISGGLPLNHLDNYIKIYGAGTQTLLYIALNLLVGLNIIVFVIILMQALQYEQYETQRLKELNEQVSRSAEELKVINLQLEEYALQSEKNAQTRERNRIAREIHDTLGHTLTGITAAIDACLELVGKDPAQLKKQLTLVSEAARSGLIDVRRSVGALRLDALERFSLGDALKKMVDEINYTTNIEVTLNYQHGKNSDEAKEIIYRVVQESITNAVRHGGASRIDIDISLDGVKTLVHISNNGASCKTIAEGFGLTHMRERVENFGGAITFDGSNGFVTNAIIPFRRVEND
ncbi:MAG: sensor histidine kinase [Clostridiales bacterium]|jgi:signal transduction histidine kinase|nr:sensor histidine kinase [Clostridiales bacterium]